MTITPESLKSDLGALAADGQRTDAFAERLKSAAEDRLAAVNARLDELRPKAVIDTASGNEYLALLAERGQLDIVVGG